FRGTVWAPHAALRLSPVDSTGHVGAFFAESIIAEANNPIQHVPFSDWNTLAPAPGSELDHSSAGPIQARWVYPDGTPLESFSYGPAAAPAFFSLSLQSARAAAA